MNNLIQIYKTQMNGAEVNSVSARDLHKALEIKRDFNAWMLSTKEILETYEEGIDYIRTTKDRNHAVVVVKKNLSLRGKQAEYIISIDMSKHIAMMSKSKKGKEVRKYFIEAEKQSKQQNFQIPQTYAEALRLSADLSEENTKLSQTIKSKDKVILAVADLNIKAGNVSFADFAKNLAIENMGRNNVIKFCKARGYLRDNTEPYQPYVNRGYFVRKPSKEKINGEVRYTTYLAPRGTVWLAKIIRAEFELDEVEI